MRLSKLASRVKDAKIICGEDWEREIVSLSCYSQDTEKSSLFFCLTGKGGDGHAYAQEAIKRGAAALVVERELPVTVPQVLVKNARETMSLMSCAFYGEPSRDLKVIGITGTNGKTTTAHMVSEILKKAGKRVGTIGTLGVSYANVHLPSDLTTPDPIFLQRTLAQMRECGVEYVAMEVSAHALYYHKVAGTYFTACIFTNLTQDHLDFFENMSDYGNAKKRLFTEEICPIAIVNGDDKFAKQLLAERKGAKTLVYGLSKAYDVSAEIGRESLTGTEFVLQTLGERRRVKLSMTGRHNIYNALASSACAQALGVRSRTVAASLCEMNGVNGRLEKAGEVQGANVFVDFAHTPDGLEKSLSALKAHCKGRLYCLFGCGGNRDKSKRAVMGETVAKTADFAILTSDNPRFEDPLDILSEIEKGYKRVSRDYVVVPNRQEAIAYAVDKLQRGDILLVAGKGGEEYQEIMGIKYPFKDNDIIKSYISEKQR